MSVLKTSFGSLVDHGAANKLHPVNIYDEFVFGRNVTTARSEKGYNQLLPVNVLLTLLSSGGGSRMRLLSA
jgi:hypothetical protein